MARIGRKSQAVIDSVDPALGSVITGALSAAPADLDFSAISGHRTAEEQQILWAEGRELKNGVWVIIDRDRVVTYKDGINDKSRHQYKRAVDVARYEKGRLLWGDIFSIPLAYYIVGFAAARGVQLTGGFRWDWDYGHLELV